ncbi:LysR substrate-binding domain-containing protein [Pigmentiphaga soli]
MTSRRPAALQRRHLQILAAIADSRSVHRAAQSLGLPQPAVSRLLADAEALLGHRLFERSARGSELTPQGAAVLAQARFVLRGLERLDGLLGESGPVVRLGCIPRAMHSLMPLVLDRMFPAGGGAPRRSAAGFRLSMMEDGSTVLVDALARGELDFGILRHPSGTAGFSEDIAAERLYDERPLVICAAGNAELPRGPVSLARLMDHGWVLPSPGSTSRTVLERFLAQQGLPPIQPVIETRSFDSNLALVADTRFITIVPESAARRYAALGVVRVVNARPVLPGSPVMLVGHPAAAEDPVLASFRRMVRAAARTMGKPRVAAEPALPDAAAWPVTRPYKLPAARSLRSK